MPSFRSAFACAALHQYVPRPHRSIHTDTALRQHSGPGGQPGRGRARCCRRDQHRPHHRGRGRALQAYRDQRTDTKNTWDERYANIEQDWGSKPNPALVTEADGLPPGQALDVGCGHGADAIWLAAQRWNFTALDVSQVALERAADRARNAGAPVRWLPAALTDAPVPPGTFDLVSAQYPALLRTPDRDAERKLLQAVAPGGVLLVVHHADVDVERAKANGFDPGDYVIPADVAALLDDTWPVEVSERRPRPVPAQGAHHTHDIVLRARRLR
jgi:SAM-dependent methyltransferase